jgi:hypothetical protein
MAKYTTQLRTIIESGYPLFDFDYPIFDEAYRAVLETKIIDYYYFREIGLETVGQFKQFLKVKMNMKMPFYNKFYSAQLVFDTYDPYKNKDVTQTDTREVSGDSTTTSNGTNKEIFQDTPSNELGDENYATNISTSDGNNTGTSTNATTETYISNLKGHDGMKYPSDILQDLRATFINIDELVINELQDLFMGVY